MDPPKTSSQVGSPALWVSGASLATAFATAIYLNKQLTSVNDEIQKNSKRLGSAIIEISKMKPLCDNVKNVANALRLLNLEGANQTKLINGMKDLIMEFDQIFDSLIPQVNNNSYQMNIMFNAINELQDLAKQNGWKIRTNLSSIPAVHPSPITENGSYLPTENINQYGEIILTNDNISLIQNHRLPHDDEIDNNKRQISPSHLNPSSNSSRSQNSRKYSEQRYRHPSPARNNSSPRDRGGNVRFSLKSDHRQMEKNQKAPAHYHTISRYRNSQTSTLPLRNDSAFLNDSNKMRNYPKTQNRQFTSTAHNHQYRTSHRSQELDENDTQETRRNIGSNLDRSRSGLNLNIDCDLNSSPEVGIELDSMTNNEDHGKNEILARISL